jgi:hypothetical protein
MRRMLAWRDFRVSFQSVVEPQRASSAGIRSRWTLTSAGRRSVGHFNESGGGGPLGMAQTLTLETTVIQRETRRTAEILFVPADTLRLADLQAPFDAAEIVGLQPGVSVTTQDEIQDVLFASLAGRVHPFDEGSFDRWRPQRLASSGSADAVFAEQLATQKLVPVSSSPIRGASRGAR